ncbi:MAG: capsule assembly Wzi family protein [Calditrichaeota bacterium]|nr:capsule assembly Wzi family protein [Calditrichota bacterium]
MSKSMIPLIIAVLLGYGILSANSPTSVPLDDPVYHFLERMETLGFVQDVFNGIKPFSRAQVSAYLQAAAKHRAELTAIDRRRLDDFLLDYRWELRRKERNPLLPDNQNWYSILAGWQNFKKDFKRFFKQNFPEEENHVFLWETNTDHFYFDYEQGVDYEQRSDDMYRSASWQTYKFRGVLQENFGYRFEVSLHGLRGNNEQYIEEHPILKGSWSEVSDDAARYSDRTGGELSFHLKYFDLQFAQQEIAWGYGESGQLILSNNTEAYPYLSISKDWGWFKFIALHGKLQSFWQDTLPDGYRVYPDKWLAAHRLEMSLGHKVTIGLNESFIYGNRYADWAYLIPFNFYRAVQHKLRDRDNATIAVDLEYLMRPGVKIYGTIFLDEFRKKKLGTNWFGNKHAFAFGLWWVDPFKLPNLSLRFEYTAIMPWVYTHKYLINSYTSDNRSIGHWAGPNSEVYYFHLRKDWHARLVTGFKFQQWKHGENYPNENIGGDILLGHETLLGTQSKPKDTRKFLEGILNTQRTFQFYANYEIFNDFYLSGRWTYGQHKRQSESATYRELMVGVLLKY